MILVCIIGQIRDGFSECFKNIISLAHTGQIRQKKAV